MSIVLLLYCFIAVLLCCCIVCIADVLAWFSKRKSDGFRCVSIYFQQ